MLKYATTVIGFELEGGGYIIIKCKERMRGIRYKFRVKYLGVLLCIYDESKAILSLYSIVPG